MPAEIPIYHLIVKLTTAFDKTIEKCSIFLLLLRVWVKYIAYNAIEKKKT